MNNEQAKIDIYLSQPEIRMALDMLSLKYNFVVDELAKSILEDELLSNEAVDFLITEFNFDPDKAVELVDKLSENVVEPFYVGDIVDSGKPLATFHGSGQATIDKAEDVESGSAREGKPIIKIKEKKVNWRNFIRPKVLQIAMEELTKASSGDVARVRNYLWQYLGLNKAEEVVVVLSWLARTGELVKLWQDDNRFRGILKKHVSMEYSQEKAEAVMSSKITPALLGLSLQMVLKTKLGLSAQDSAMIGMAIIDQMPDEDKPKYILVAYIDAKDNSFNWNQIQETAQSLQLAT